MTQERIWRLDEGGDPTPLTETAYDSEAALQKLIADHPEVLAGERMTPDEPRRWLLISREMGIPDSPDSGDRWAVDHLLLDQDARPTLVEVKRGDNPEIRRRVVGQMLDYAAHATRYWTADTIRERLEAESGGEDAARGRIARLQSGGESGDGAYEEFWERVDRNLADERIRLLFVADRIPPDLEHVVEFLNRHMGPRVEVLAVELKQYRGEGVRTLVPRVAGRSDRSRSAAARSRHTRETLLAEFPEGRIREATRQLLDRATAAGAVFNWGPNRVSIRVPCPAWKYRVTVAWIYAPGATGFGGRRDFSFGGNIFEGYDDPPPPRALRDALLRYAGLFEGDSWSHDAPSRGVIARWVAPDDVAQNIETLTGRVEGIVRQIATLPSADK